MRDIRSIKRLKAKRRLIDRLGVLAVKTYLCIKLCSPHKKRSHDSSQLLHSQAPEAGLEPATL